MEKKQIEEMANIIALKAFEQAHIINGDDNLADIVATALYNAGYRKASEVAEEIFAENHNTLLKVIDTVDKGLDKAIRDDNEEAKLIHSGTLETLKCLILIFAELKKKYTEEGK